MFVLFDRNKKFIGYSPDIPDGANIFKKEIPEDQSDIRLWAWVGDFDSGKMVSIETGYPIEEIELENQLFGYIRKKYPLHVQMSNIIRQLRIIVRDNDMPQDDEFMDMADCIINSMDKHNKRVNYYKNYGNLIPKHESEKQFNDTFKKQ